MAINVWVSDRRIYLNAIGQAVEASDPARVSLLVAQGGTIPLADAERLGLTGEKAKAAPANKAKASKAENK